MAGTVTYEFIVTQVGEDKKMSLQDRHSASHDNLNLQANSIQLVDVLRIYALVVSNLVCLLLPIPSTISTSNTDSTKLTRLIMDIELRVPETETLNV